MNDRHTPLEALGSGLTNAHGVKVLQQSKDKLLADMKTVVDDAQALMKEAVDTSAQGINAVPAYLEDRLSAVKCNLQQVRSAFEAKAKQAGTVTDHYVRENPWKSLGVVTAASVFASILLVRACASTFSKNRKD
jgi:ElaB/YqjD/DUF883 family membrane-anchored ribosome-binding protein